MIWCSYHLVFEINTCRITYYGESIINAVTIFSKEESHFSLFWFGRVWVLNLRYVAQCKCEQVSHSCAIDCNIRWRWRSSWRHGLVQPPVSDSLSLLQYQRNQRKLPYVWRLLDKASYMNAILFPSALLQTINESVNYSSNCLRRRIFSTVTSKNDNSIYNAPGR